MTKKQTALEWFNERLSELDAKYRIELVFRIERDEILERAKEMEREQLFDEWSRGFTEAKDCASRAWADRAVEDFRARCHYSDLPSVGSYDKQNSSL